MVQVKQLVQVVPFLLGSSPHGCVLDTPSWCAGHTRSWTQSDANRSVLLTDPLSPLPLNHGEHGVDGFAVEGLEGER